MELKKSLFCVTFISCIVGLGLAGEIIDLVGKCEGQGELQRSAEVTSLLLDGCDQDVDEECLAIKGENATGKVTFKVNKDITSMECSLKASLGGSEVWIPFPGGGCGTKNGCEALEGGAGCPLKAGTTATIDISIKVPSYAPTASLTGKYIQKDGGAIALCYTFPMKIVKPDLPTSPQPSKSTGPPATGSTATKSPATGSTPTKSPITEGPKTTSNSGAKVFMNIAVIASIMIVNMLL